MNLGVVFIPPARSDSPTPTSPCGTEKEMTSLLILNAILATAIVAGIVGMLAFAIKSDRRSTIAPKLRTVAQPRSTARQMTLSLASTE